MFSLDSAAIAPSFHWCPASQRRFIACLAETGSVQRACDSVSMARTSAYRFRRRGDALAFRIGWDAAVLWARQVHGDVMMEYATLPVEQIGVRHPETRRLRWRRVDPALGRGKGTALLARLDKAYDAIAAREADYALAEAALADFDLYLDLVGHGASPDEIMAFLVQSGGSDLRPFMCNLGQNSALFDSGTSVTPC